MAMKRAVNRTAEGREESFADGYRRQNRGTAKKGNREEREGFCLRLFTGANRKGGRWVKCKAVSGCRVLTKNRGRKEKHKEVTDSIRVPAS